MERDFGKSFMRILVEDALTAQARRKQADSDRHRREEIRATFAAIEGVTWICREQVRQAARSLDVLTPYADLALQERTFGVTDKGDIVEQVRYITLPTILRLTIKQARLVSPSIELDVKGTGWMALTALIGVRNRVTHPKSVADLAISDADLASAAAGLLWLMQAVDTISQALVEAQRTYNEVARNVVDDLIAGDADTWAAYRTALDQSDD